MAQSRNSESAAKAQARAKRRLLEQLGGSQGTELGVNDKTPAEVQLAVDRQRYDQQFGAGAYDRMKAGR